MIKTFISHSSSEDHLVKWLEVELKRDMPFLDIFADHSKNRTGDEARKMINEAKRAVIFISVLSNDYISKQFCLNERKASKKNKYAHEFPILYKIDKDRIPRDLKIRFTKTKDRPKGILYNDFSDEKVWGIKYQLLAKSISDKVLELGLELNEDFYQNCEVIDLILTRKIPTNREIKIILDVYLIQDEYQRYFFKKLDNLSWLRYFKIYGYLDSNPKPIESVESPGHFQIPHWHILDYLEKVSAKKNISVARVFDLLEIIDYVTKKKDEFANKIDNYRTWWAFVKILLNIPNDKIREYLEKEKIDIAEDWLKEWIASKFDNMLSASEMANKLLPKFLTNESPDIEIAEKIVEVITGIKWEQLSKEETKLYIFPKKAEPRTVVESYWLFESFKKNAQKIGELCSEKVIYDLANKLKEIFDKESEDHQVFIELNGNTYKIFAKRIKGFDFEILIGLLRKDELNALKPENRILGILNVSSAELYNFSIKDTRNKESFVKTIKEEISENIKVSFLKDIGEIDKKLKNLYDGLYSDNSYIWFKSLASDIESGIREAKEVLTAILRDILMAKCKADIKAGKDILGKFLSDDYQYPLFRRLILFVVANSWQEYKYLFWEFINDGRNQEVFIDPHYELELFRLLKNNVSRFDLLQKEIIKKVFEKGLYGFEDLDEEYMNFGKLKWYLSVKGDTFFSDRYQELSELVGIEPKEPSESGFYEYKPEEISPLGKEDILRISNEELASHIFELKSKGLVQLPFRDSFTEVLKLVVKENPVKFADNLEPFLELGYLYVYNILYGLEDAWKEKKIFDWGKVFDFTEKYIEKPTFGIEDKEVTAERWRVTYTWIINVIADLIQEGTRDDSWAFAEDYFNQAEEILDIMIEKLPVKQEEPHRDAVSYALNTSYGRVTIALIYLSLRKARVEEKRGIKKEIKWEPTKYENLLNKGVIEAFTLFGQYMSNLTYLNKPWVEKKIKEFEGFFKDDIKWLSFIDGYLFSGRVYQDLYKSMRNHYQKAIDTDFKEGHAEERLVQHIAIGYLRGYESLEGEESLFKKIIDKWKYSQLTKIVSFFWLQRDYLVRQIKEGRETEENGKIKDRIIGFWRWIYNENERGTIKDKLKDNYKKLLSDLTKLTIFLDNIDSENSKWLLRSAPYVEIDFNSSFFIEYLDKFEDEESIKFIGKIFLEMLSETTPDYDQKHIISIVNKIYLVDKTEAGKICSIYGSRGYEFLRPIYEEKHDIK